MAFKQVRII